MQGLYFACVTVTTVGYGTSLALSISLSQNSPPAAPLIRFNCSPGDLFFTTNGGKWFSMFYVLLGTIVIAKALGDVASIPTVRLPLSLFPLPHHRVCVCLLHTLCCLVLRSGAP